MSQPSAEERAARSVMQPEAVASVRILTDEALSQRLTNLRHQPRTFSKLDRDATLDEAAKRLRWGTQREKQLEEVENKLTEQLERQLREQEAQAEADALEREVQREYEEYGTYEGDEAAQARVHELGQQALAREDD